MKAIRTSVVILVSFLLAVAPTFAGSIVFLVRTGTDAQGNPVFRQATTADGNYLTQLNSGLQNSRATHNMLRYYDATQRDHYAQALSVRGYSSAQIQQALARYVPDPVYIEVNGNSSGAYNDWKAKFTVQQANGYAYQITSPRIVFPLGSQVARSGNWSLIEQTLIHEMGHGVQAKAYGINRLPTSPWLSKAHTGGSHTDQALALIEGYAEYVGTYFTGRDTIAEDQNGTVSSNYYAYDKSTGRIKPWSQLVATEGWVATTLYYIAKQGASQDAAWKMTRVMTYTAPRTTTELLVNMMRYYPELTPTIQSVLYATTGGQVGSQSGQVARAPAAPGSSGTAPAAPGSTTAAAPSATSGESYASMGARATNPYDRFHYATLDGGQGMNIEAEYQNVRMMQANAESSPDGETLLNVQRGSQILNALYGYQASLLSSLPVSDARRYQVQQNMGMIADLATRQVDLQQKLSTTASTNPGLYTAPAAPAAPGPAAPIDETYNAMTNAVSSSGEDAEAALRRYTETFQSRQAQRREAFTEN